MYTITWTQYTTLLTVTAPYTTKTTKTPTPSIVTHTTITSEAPLITTQPSLSTTTFSSPIPRSSFSISPTPLTGNSVVPGFTATEMSSFAFGLFSASIPLTQALTYPSGTPSTEGIFGPISGLSNCAQNILFPAIADSSCNPADFPCVCKLLETGGVQGIIGATCDAGQVQQANQFFESVCPNNNRPVPPSSTSTSPITVTSHSTSSSNTPLVSTSTSSKPSSTSVVPTTSASATILPSSADLPIITTITIIIPTISLSTNIPLSTSGTGGGGGGPTTAGPFANSTIIPLFPSLTTSTILIPTTDNNGSPTTLTQETAVPFVPVVPTAPNSNPNPTGPGGPEFTGAAAAVEPPEFWGGGIKASMLVGAIRIMGLVFAEF